MSKKTKQVVALRYEGDSAPKVTAKGQGKIAEQILQVASEYNIPLYQDKELTQLLSKVDLGDEIPEKLYHAIAKVLYFIYMIEGKMPINLLNQTNNKRNDNE
jgi:flagellar biosynthesis protein